MFHLMKDSSATSSRTARGRFAQKRQEKMGDCRESCAKSAAELVCTESLILVWATIPGAACSPLMRFSSWRAPYQSERS